MPMTTLEYLDAARVKLGLRSDYALAVTLGVPRQTISNYRRPGPNRSILDNLIAAKVAELLHIDPMRVIADMEIERARRAEKRELEMFWRRIGASVGKAAAGVLVSVGLVGAPAPAPAAQNAPEPLCIMSTRRRRSPLAMTAEAVLQSLALLPASGRRIA